VGSSSSPRFSRDLRPAEPISVSSSLRPLAFSDGLKTQGGRTGRRKMPAWDSLSLIRTGEYICAKPSWPPAEHIVQPDQDGHTASGSGGWWSSRQAAIRRIAAARHDPQRSAPLLTDCVEEQQHRHSHRGRAAPGMDAFRAATTPRPSGFQRAICVSERLIPARLSVLAMVASQGLSGWCGSCAGLTLPGQILRRLGVRLPASCVNTVGRLPVGILPCLRLVTPGLAEWQVPNCLRLPR
jgi:hypothetical protein